MEMDKECSSCSEKQTCKSIYEALGKSKGQSVAVKVIIVFLLPILFFIAGLLICENFIKIENNKLNIAVSALLSAILTFFYILIARFFVKKSISARKIRTENIKES